jgi:hypothetical protein
MREYTPTANIHGIVVENLAKLLEENYACPDRGAAMATHIREKLERGAYDITEAHALCQVLTDDLQAISNDLHINVYYDPEEAAEIARLENSDEEEANGWWSQLGYINYGFARVERMAGNIGYIDLREFSPVSHSGDTIAAAMALIAHTNALIFDLRQNGGGDGFTVQLIESYLFAGEPKLLLTHYNRQADQHQQIWTLPHVPGKRLPDIPVYILTSGRTFSGAEDFSYTLKHLGRATIVGETTAGGANPIDYKIIHEGFLIFLPIGYPTHPVTNSNWEGSGVEPHIPVSRELALQTAHIHALESLIEECQDETEMRRLNWALERMKASYTPVVVDEALLAGYVGRYGRWVVTLKDGALFMSRSNRRDDWLLVPSTETEFFANEMYKIRFVVTAQNISTTLIISRRDTTQDIAIPKAAQRRSD